MAKNKIDYPLQKHDKQHFENAMKGKELLNKEVFKRLMLHDICSTNLKDNEVKIGNYTIDEILKTIANPRGQEQKLLAMNAQMMRVSPHYKRVVLYYGNLGTFDWYIDVVDNGLTPKYQEMLMKQYSKLAFQLDKMNLKHEFNKIMNIIASQDLYCGLVNESDSDFFFQKINPSHCKVYQIQDGIYNFAINLASIKPTDVEVYPIYIQKAIADWLNGKIPDPWYVPEPDKQICIKFDESTVTAVPFLLSTVEDLFDLKKYKQLKLQSARTDNYKAFITEVPFDSDEPDTPMVSIDTLELFAELNRQSLNENVAMIHSAGKTQAVSFKDNANTRNNVGDATDDFYNSAGTNSVLFNGGTSGSALNFSLQNDATLIFRVYRQFERWLNRFIKYRKYNKSQFKFEVVILDSTHFNREEVFNRYLKAAQYGAPTKRQIMASLGVTPSKANGGLILENALGWHDNWKPLSSSYTESSDDKSAGRPTEDIVDEEGERNRLKV